MITLQQLLDFIAAQPADKPIHMLQNYFTDSCGCLMVQYGRSIGISEGRCGLSSFYDKSLDTIETLDDAGRSLICDLIALHPSTYGEIHESLRITS